MYSRVSIFAVLLALSLVPAYAVASQESPGHELNDESGVTNSQRNTFGAQLPATVVVRVSNVDKSVAVLQSQEKIAANPLAASEGSFVSMNASDRLSARGDLNSKELNQDSSTDSWYFYFNNYSYFNPCYGYGGYNFGYQPYYNYNYGAYSYYYYYNPWRWY